MPTYTVYQVDAFTRKRFTGNPAGVVPHAQGLTTAQMQALARELNNSETAFILPPTSDNHELRIRYFTPTMEVPTCGHATISAHYIRAIEQQLVPRRVWHRIGIGRLPVDVQYTDGDYRVIMTQGPPEIMPPLGRPEQQAVLDALGLSPADLHPDCPIQLVTTGSSKILIGLHSVERVHALTPNLGAIAALNKWIPNRGFFVFAFAERGADVCTHSRMFAPHNGIPEDPVTGNGHGPLGAYLAHHKLVHSDGSLLHFRGRQGEAIGRPGTAHVWVHMTDGTPTQVRVGGDAIIAFKTEVVID